MLIAILIIIIIVVAIINTKRDCEEPYINKPTVLGGNPPNYTDYNTDLTFAIKSFLSELSWRYFAIFAVPTVMEYGCSGKE